MLELYKTDDDQYYVQIFYRRFNEEHPQPLNVPGCGTKFSVQQFLDHFKEIIPENDFDSECRLQLLSAILWNMNMTVLAAINANGKKIEFKILKYSFFFVISFFLYFVLPQLLQSGNNTKNTWKLMSVDMKLAACTYFQLIWLSVSFFPLICFRRLNISLKSCV